ncbi:reverse transcriptase domain-containing protein, partial [Tanacetum coccineum]
MPQPTPLVGVPNKENLNRCCDYHNEKGHNTNDCFHLKRQLEIALESGKLNHLIKDVRQKGKGGQRNNGPQKAKVINMVQSHPLGRKRKTTMTDERWMNVPIIFPPVPARDLLEEALVVEAEVEGYLVKPLGKIKLDVCFGGSGRCRRAIMKFTVIPSPSPYNIILGRPSLKQLRAVPSTIHGMMKFPTPWGVATVVSQMPVVFECRSEGKKQAVEPSENKVDGSWRMCIDFKNINSACPKDYYPLPEIDSKIEAVMGFPLKCFLDAYKGYHQVQMADEDEEKTAFYTDQGTYCYTKMSFGLKNAGATYQRLVDEAFQSQIGKNLEVYVDDMVVKSRTEREMLADIAETFDNLRRINMKLNPKKCSFGVTEGKFLGYMVTSEGIRANPAKTKDIAEMQSPRTWGEMQSLAGKLAALNRFLSRSAEKSLPFFETLKDITKENKHDYRWTEEAESAFQELKKMVLDLPALITPLPKETLFIYLAASQEAVSAVLLVVRRGRQHPVHYVSRTLHDAERNYAPLEKKMALALRHVSRRLRRYFEAHPITVITDQPIKQVLNKADTSGRLAPYSLELAAYNITYEPRSAIKGQILADFINEVPVGSEAMVGSGKGHPTRILLANNAPGCKRRNTQVRLMPDPLLNPQVAQNTNDLNHGPLAILPMGDGCVRTFPEAPGKVRFIIVVVDYFTKWIKAKPLAKTIGKEVKKFVWDNIICRETPYSLTFGSEAVIPAEIGMPTHRTMMIKEGNGNEEKIRLNLDLLTERREAAAIREA